MLRSRWRKVVERRQVTALLSMVVVLTLPVLAGWQDWANIGWDACQYD
jgi:hypothetical protein